MHIHGKHRRAATKTWIDGIGAKVYSSLLRYHLNSASRLSERSGVPRTKIYSVLESLAAKGWIKVYSGAPLLFKPLDPAEIFERMKRDYEAVLEVAGTMLDRDEVKMKEKFVITKYDVGLEKLKELGEVAVTSARIYTEYDGEEANSGSVAFSDVIFNIAWVDGKILDISTMEYSKCVKCLRETFEGAWRYAKK